MRRSLLIKKHGDYNQVYKYGFSPSDCPGDFTPYDLTGSTVETVFYTTSFSSPILVANLSNGKMNMNPTVGEIYLSLAPTDVALLSDSCRYRMILTRPDALKIVLLFGNVYTI